MDRLPIAPGDSHSLLPLLLAPLNPMSPSRRRRASQLRTRALAGVLAVVGLVWAAVLTSNALWAGEFTWWTDQGCALKILSGTEGMNETMQVMPSARRAWHTLRPRVHCSCVGLWTRSVVALCRSPAWQVAQPGVPCAPCQRLQLPYGGSQQI